MSKWPLVQLDKHIIESKEQYGSEKLNGIQVLSVTNDQGFVFSDKRTSENVSNYKIIKSGYFAYNPYRINVGSLAFAGNEYSGIVSPAYVVFSCADDLNPEYLWKYLKSDVGLFHIRQGGKGSVRSSLSFERLQEIEIPLPPLPEQKRIVKKIKEIEENADELVKANNNRKKEAESLIASVLNKLFTGNPNWESVELEKVAPLVTDNFIPSSKPREQFKYLALESIESYTSKLLDVPNVEGQKIKSSTNRFDERHVLYAKLRPYLNKVIAPDFSGISTTELIILKPNQEKIVKEFLVYFLKNPKFVDEATKISAGTKMPRVNTKWLKKQKVRFPKSTTEQLGIVSDLKQLESKIDNLKLDINKVDNYISALMPSVLSKAFNGEL